MKILIDSAGVVSDAVALQMALQILTRDDGTVKFSEGLAVEIRTAKTQRSFKVVKQDAV